MTISFILNHISSFTIPFISRGKKSFKFEKELMVDSGTITIMQGNYNNFDGDISNDLYVYRENDRIVAFILQV